MATTYKWAIKTSSKVDQAAKLIRIYCVLNNMYPSETGVTLCAYIMIYGYSKKTRAGIIKIGLLNKETSIKNEVYSLKRLGLLEGNGNNVKVTSKLTGGTENPTTPQTLIMINLDNR